MLLGARQFFERRGAPAWTNPYVTDGLVAMWDGEWNAGGGVHDPNATTWKDLVGARDWTLGPSTSYAWTTKSFDAKDQFAATQDFIDGSLVSTVEVCAKIKVPSPAPTANYAFIIIGRMTTLGRPYYGLLYRFVANSIMGGRSYFIDSLGEFDGIPATFSFPSYMDTGVAAYFNGSVRAPSGYNSLDYNATTRGTVARIGGTVEQPLPIEVHNIRLYSRALTAEEIAANYAIDQARFNLP